MNLDLLKRYSFAGEKRACLVLGSAPDPQLPEKLRDTTTLVCVNSSGWAAQEAEWPTPALTVMAGFKLTARHTAADRAALAGLATDTLVLVKKFPNDRPATTRQAQSILRRLGYSYGRCVTMSQSARRRMLWRKIGYRMDGSLNDAKPSNGILALCLALRRGSPRVILAGFSLQRSGHHYDRVGDRMRQHSTADQAAIVSMRTRGWPLATTEPELAEVCGLELVT